MKKEKGIRKGKLRVLATDFAFLLLASCLGSFSTVGILIPNGLSSGGITGLSRIIQEFTNVEFSVIYYAFAVLVWVACLIFLGWKEARKTLFMTLLYPSVLVIFEELDLQLLEQPDMILACVYCGVFYGACSGIIFWRGYSSGGNDTVAKIIKKKLLPEIDVSKIMLVLDAAIIIGSGLVFGRNVALYALITVLIQTRVIDFILFGVQTRIVQMEIISQNYAEIADYIMTDIARGVSIESIVGAYTNEERKKLVTFCSPRESMLIKRFIANNDRGAFVTTVKVDNVWGNGKNFRQIDKEN